MLGIIGPNGAGKTSLFEVLSGRMRPKSGKVIFKGREVTGLRLHERAPMGRYLTDGTIEFVVTCPGMLGPLVTLRTAPGLQLARA